MLYIRDDDLQLAFTTMLNKLMMQNQHYLGDDFYPVIIDQASFDAVSVELSKSSHTP